ncbi:hypothetical protein [Bifidobacterium aquikefiricola]|uniref:Uncharacterized protein n=1 Tax=Bifidobacterium aquikefiricola TaxID=3059038 RepID=A0AB39U7A8_9BIFI
MRFHYASELYSRYGQRTVDAAWHACINCPGQTYSDYDSTTGRRIGPGSMTPTPATTAIPDRYWAVFVANVEAMK